MKITTIQKYISLMESMLDSDATSLDDYCIKYNIKASTFRTQLYAIKKEVHHYYYECNRAMELWEEVKEHFKQNKQKLNKCGVETIATENVKNNDSIQWNGKEDPKIFNQRVLDEIERLKKLLIQEESLTLTPETPQPTLDENYWDNLTVLNCK